MAFEPGHGRTAVPVRSALAGTAVAVAAVVAALVFGTSLLALVGTPHRYGQNWEQELDLQVGSIPLAQGGEVLARITGLTGYASGNYGQVSIAVPGSRSATVVPAIGLDQERGAQVLDPARETGPGRAPSGRSSRDSAWPAAAPPTWGPAPWCRPRCCPSPTPGLPRRCHLLQLLPAAVPAGHQPAGCHWACWRAGGPGSSSPPRRGSGREPTSPCPRAAGHPGDPSPGQPHRSRPRLDGCPGSGRRRSCAANSVRHSTRGRRQGRAGVPDAGASLVPVRTAPPRRGCLHP